MNVFRLSRGSNYLISRVVASTQPIFSSMTISESSCGSICGNGGTWKAAPLDQLKVLRAPLVQIRNFSSDSSSSAPATKERFDKLVKNNKIVVFMKGVPDEPRCGFSNAVVQVLRMHGVSNYDSHNVLEDEGIRQGIKDYTNWPTIPQVFINGEFVGGCDILIEMHKNGELVEQLSKVGIKSALLEQEQTENKEK